jgi:DNA-binding CsgD family transcriptional regulator
VKQQTSCVDAAFSSAVSGIYDAALAPERWHELLGELIEFLGCHRGMYGMDDRSGRVFSQVQLFHGVDEAAFALWEREFSNQDPWHEHHVRRGAYREGFVLHHAATGAIEEVRRTEIYQECFRWGGADDRISITLVGSPSRVGFLSVYRSESEGFFEAESVRRAVALAPHLVRAERIARRLRVEGGLTAALVATAEQSPHGVVVLDERGAVRFASERALGMLAQEDGIALRGSRLAAAAPASRRALEEAVHAASTFPMSGVVPRATFVTITRRASLQPWQLLVCPVPARSRDELFVSSDRDAAVLVLISDPAAERRPNEEALRLLFGLTPALARLAASIAAGDTVSEYAERHRVTVGTARNQVKELFARTGARRQAELVRLLLSGVAQLDAQWIERAGDD